MLTQVIVPINPIKQLCQILTKVTQKNISDNKKQLQSDPFSANPSTLTVSINFYFERIKKYTEMEHSTMIIALIYIDRLCQVTKIKLCPANIHRILLTCCILAIKYNEDSVFDRDFYSKVGGISFKELDNLERYCLKRLDYNLYVKDEVFEKYSGIVYNCAYSINEEIGQ